MNRRTFLSLAAAAPAIAAAADSRFVEIPVATLEDKLRGGLLGQILGDLNGLIHEMKYILEPGNVEEYTPALPEGAWTDDDTDVEWPYILEIQKTGKLLLPYDTIATIWKRSINRRIWCSHLFLRQLLDIGIEPPLTGKLQINPWADFNLSGQFVAESWGLISPGMPQTAARIGTHYTHVSIEGEAIQSTQMIDAMIATAYLTNDMQKVLDAGQAALDPASVMHQITVDVRRWHKENPKDWRVTRKLTLDKYCKYGGHDIRDRNGVWLNGASTLSAMLYGDGDFVQTVRSAFNFGWDADNNAAASGTILGIMKGAKVLGSQGWNIKDVYRDTSRDNVPTDETITKFGDRMIALTKMNVLERGGSVTNAVYRIPVEKAANIEKLNDPKKQYENLRTEWKPKIEKGIQATASAQERARAAYLAICLDFAPELRQRSPELWTGAIAALQSHDSVLQAIYFQADLPAGKALMAKADAAGLHKPAVDKKINTL